MSQILDTEREASAYGGGVVVEDVEERGAKQQREWRENPAEVECRRGSQLEVKCGSPRSLTHTVIGGYVSEKKIAMIMKTVNYIHICS